MPLPSARANGSNRLHSVVITFMAECFWPGVTFEQVAEAGESVRQAALAINSDGLLARYNGSILIPTDEIALFLFEASSLAVASDLNQRAGIPSERILEVVRLDPR